MGKAYDFSDLPFRDHNDCSAGNLHNHLVSWKDITVNLEVLKWMSMSRITLSTLKARIIPLSFMVASFVVSGC